MGEGWGDFFAICMTSQPADDFDTGVFAAGGWTDITSSFEDNYYYSIRRYPYSVDLGKNPLTFTHIQRGVSLPSGPPRKFSGDNAQIHNAGEIWCSMLWEVFVRLVGTHGHAEAEERMLRYVIGGMKQTPNNPTFTEARDGVLAAVAALHPEDLSDVWTGFARRGMGKGAVSPARFSSDFNGVVESFDIPDDLRSSSNRSESPGVIIFDLGNTLEFRDALRGGVIETLNEIDVLTDAHGNGIVMTLLSDYFPARDNQHAAELRQRYLDLVNSLGLADYFNPADERITLSTDLSVDIPGIYKPDPRLFRASLDKLGSDLPFSKALFVTENEQHIQVAETLGMSVLHVPEPSQANTDFPGESLLAEVRRFVGQESEDARRTAMNATARTAGALSIRLGSETITDFDLPQLDSTKNLHLVMQKGRLFELQHPEVRILQNRGRFLIAELTRARETIPDSDDFKIIPLENDFTVFRSVDRQEARIERDSEVNNLLAELDPDDFMDDVMHLASFDNRHSVTSGYADASQWAFEQFGAIGYATKLQVISVDGELSRNVIAEKTGTGTDRQVVLVVAHLDSINLFGASHETNIAPGADDNASGSAGVLQIARVFHDVDTKHDLRLILFGGEEQGLFGSTQYVASLSEEERARISAVVNMDMIGTLNTSDQTVLIEGPDSSTGRELIDAIGSAFATYTDLEIQTSTMPFASDHVPFIDAGIPAVLTIEGADSANQNAHTINDTVDTINVDYAIKILKGNVAHVAQTLEVQ